MSSISEITEQTDHPNTETAQAVPFDTLNGEDQPSDDDDEDDPEFQQLELEFIAYVRRKLTPEELESASPETMEKLLEQFQDIKRKQYKEQAILEQQVKIITTRFPHECDERYKQFFNPQYWLDNLDPSLQAALAELSTHTSNTSQESIPACIEELAQHVYRVPMYRKDFLDRLSDFLVYSQLWIKHNKLSVAPPNTMNRYGLTLQHIGLSECIQAVIECVLGTLTRALFPWLITKHDHHHGHHHHHHDHHGHHHHHHHHTDNHQDSKDLPPEHEIDQVFDSFHAFIVRYKSTEAIQTVQQKSDVEKQEEGAEQTSDAPSQETTLNAVVTDEDRFLLSTLTTPSSDTNVSSLSLHTDTSHVTLNLCLGKDFDGGRLYFKGHRCQEHCNLEFDLTGEDSGESPEAMEAEARRLAEDLHLEQVVGSAYIHLGTLRHGAEPITSGYRENLIIWAVASDFPVNRSPCLVCQLMVDQESDEEQADSSAQAHAHHHHEGCGCSHSHSSDHHHHSHHDHDHDHGKD